ncbi:hypothetical protein LRP49_02170 [Enterovibrio sp. ZSDZ35]|uniref:Uncharacterized protein n=1 Tax=Enterovibrio qingdaonensis TaxID=2899818 RepID=A0ABT5QG89_9GAMM|nr:hypothetical protein [Enterovibrio sp. ZSDZ35]MDD1779993.1 hypothetical protein [Enterovibrio sp. ZSDZ35]
MHVNRWVSVLLIFCSVSSFQVRAANTNTCQNEDYAVVFFNGVLTDRFEAEINVRETKYALGHGTQYNQEDLRYVLAYNQSGKANGFVSALEDFAETFEQRSAEYDQILSERWELFWAILRGEQSSGFFDYLGDVLAGYFKLLQAALSEQRHDVITQLLSFLYNNQADLQTTQEHQAILDSLMWRGNKMVLVAHSQGNLYMNKAYEHAINVKAYSSADAVKALHIAPASPILNGNHILSDADYVITSLDLFTGWNINTNFHWPSHVDKLDPVGHNYVDIYLNAPSGLRGRVIAAINAELLSVTKPDMKEFLVEVKLTPKFNLQKYYSASVQLTDYQQKLYTAGYDNYDPNNPPDYLAMKVDGSASNQDLAPTEINGDPYKGYRVENCGEEDEQDWLKHGSYMLTVEYPFDKGEPLRLNGAPQPGTEIEVTDRFGEKLKLRDSLFPGNTGSTSGHYMACVDMGLRNVVSLDQDDYKPYIKLFRQLKIQMPSKLKIEEIWPFCLPH